MEVMAQKNVICAIFQTENMLCIKLMEFSEMIELRVTRLKIQTELVSEPGSELESFW